MCLHPLRTDLNTNTVYLDLMRLQSGSLKEFPGVQPGEIRFSRFKFSGSCFDVKPADTVHGTRREYISALEVGMLNRREREYNGV